MYELVSDIEGLSVEWDGAYGKYWQSFETKDDMDKALEKNEAHNNTPEIKEMIERDLNAENIWLAQCDLEYYGGLEWLVENNMKKDFAEAIKDAKKYGEIAVKHIANLVLAHNKRVIKTKFVPAVSTNAIGDFL